MTNMSKNWAGAQLAADRREGLPKRLGRDDVTAVAYAFGEPERMERYGEAIELAKRANELLPGNEEVEQTLRDAQNHAP